MYFQLLVQYIVIVVCFIAGLAQFAADRGAAHNSLHILRAARRVTAAALMVVAIYIFYSIQEYGGADRVLCLVVGLIGLGQLLFAIHTFYEPSQTVYLMAPWRKRRHHEATHT
jgi:hypothetical protein